VEQRRSRFDDVYATGNVFVSNVAYGNYRNGFSFEGFSSGNSLYDNIAADMACRRTSPRPVAGQQFHRRFASDYNILWNSTAQPPIRVGLARFATSPSSPRDSASIRTPSSSTAFVAPAAGDFHLRADSPAIDAADTDVPGWQMFDAMERPHQRSGRGDGGFGPVSYADRGHWNTKPHPSPVRAASSRTRRKARSRMRSRARRVRSAQGQPEPGSRGANIQFRLSRQGQARC